MSGSCLGRDFSSMVGLSRVWLSLGLVVSLTAGLLMGLPSPAGAVAGYGDVGEGTWYTDAVQWSTDNGIADIAGFCFGPDTPVSRGETAVWIYNMENQPDAGDPHSFSDVTDASQDDAISWMANTGITTGTSPTTFAPDENLKRAQAAAFLHRLAGEPAAPPHSFVDVVTAWQQGGVSWMAHTGITTGTSPTTFAPEDTLTRAHLVTFLYRYQDEPDVTLNTTTPDCDPTTDVDEDPAATPPASFKAVSAGSNHSCAIRTDDTITCWGHNGSGQGDAPTGSFKAVSAGEAHSCGIRIDNTITCWGDNYDGQADAPTGGFKTVSVGQFHSCGIRADDTITCWGNNDDGQTDAPTGNFKAVSAGRDHNCGIRTDNTTTCWGNNEVGQTDAPAGRFKAVSTGDEHSCGIRTDDTITCWYSNDDPTGSFKAVSAGGGHNCGLGTDDTITCWGNNRHGEADAPTGSFKTVSAGRDHSCGIRADDTIICWGYNGSGQTDAATGGFKAVSAGGSHSCGIGSDDTIICWGYNGSGQTDAATGGFKAVSAGGDHSCAIRTDDTITCWGHNGSGQTDAATGSFKAVSAGHDHSCGIHTDDTITCWGHNYWGQADAPTGSFKAVSAGQYHNCGIRTDDTITCWGHNYWGQADAPTGGFKAVSADGDHSCGLGTDDTITCWGRNWAGQTYAPTGGFKAVSAGRDHSCGIRTDDTITCWGNNGSGQTDAPTGSFKAVRAGGGHSCGIHTDDTITCWGNNGSGQADAPSFLPSIRVGSTDDSSTDDSSTTTTTCRASSDASYVVPVAITDLVSRSQFPAWSPDCAEIAYSRHLDVAVMSPSGEHLRDVWNYRSVLSGVSGAGRSPSWSPDGTRIALSAENTGSGDPWTRNIYVVNTDGSEATRHTATRLTQGSPWDNDPSWSPDGTEIVFNRSFYQGDSYLVTVAADGTGETVLTAGGVGEHSPSWSPDGQSIGFLTEHGELKVMSPDGSNQRIVVAGNAATTGMSWSADSSQIAYARVHDNDDSCVSIMVVNADGTGTRRITNLAGRSTQPAWSPDGELLLFANSPISGFSRIYVVDPNVDSGLDPDEPCPPIDSYEPDDSLTVGYEQQLGIPQGDVPASGLACRPPRRSGYASTGFPRPIRAPTIGNLRVAVLFVDFPGAVSAFSTEAEISAPNYDLVHVPSEGTFTSNPDNLATIEQYLETASYGKLDMELVPLDKWLRTPHSLLSFLVDYDAFFQRSAVSEDINLESVGLAGTEIDWSTIDMVMTVLPSTYFQGGNAAGAVRINDRIVPTLRLNVIPRGEALSAPSPWGRVGAHELLHVLGLTDLYPTQQPGYQGEFVVPTPPEGMGYVHVRAGLMGLEGYYFAPLDHLNGWNSFGQSPKEMLAWHRWQLGWLEPHQISCVTEPPTTITLRSVTDPGSGIAMAAIPISDTKQIVIESRRSTGYDRLQLLRIDEGGASVGQDRSRTYGGVLVYTVDSSLSELPIKFATDDGDGVLERSPLLAAGSSVVIDGYEIRVIADAGDTHTVQVTKLS